MAGVGDWKHIKKAECPHISELPPEADQPLADNEKGACEARLPDGQVCGYNEDLRICLTCGKVFCCESHNAHNTEHFKSSDHPFVKPHKCDYNWLWCYKCNAFLEF